MAVPRAIVVAAGDLHSLPDELQDVANILSASGWTLRLCLGDEASRAGLGRAASEGPAQLAWLICHSSAAGFGLSDGVLAPAELAAWLAQVGACECMLNSCYSLEHVTAIQRRADVGVACTIDPAGVGDTLARVAGVAVLRGYVDLNDMAAAVAAVSGNGYRYIPRPAGGGGRSRQRMSSEDQRLLEQLVNAIKGDGMTGPGLIKQWQQLSDNLAAFMAEERAARQEQERINQTHEDRLRALEGAKPIAMTERSAYIAIITVAAVAVLMLLAVLMLNGGLR